jgi:hypothetical protein
MIDLRSGRRRRDGRGPRHGRRRGPCARCHRRRRGTSTSPQTDPTTGQRIPGRTPQPPRVRGGTSEITTLTNAQAEIAASDVLPRYNPRSGFSGAYDPATGQWVALASGDASLVSGAPVQTVSQFGGHAAAEASLVQRTGASDTSRNVGFVLVWEGNNTVRLLWNSRTINERNFGDRAAPEAMRARIREVVARDTGCRVVE